jgi:hypothetical protein
MDESRFTPAELESIVLGLADRILILEAGLSTPLSYVERLSAEAALVRRRAPHEASRRIVAGYRAAQAEAERTGTDRPIDAFIRRVRAGEFDATR